MRAQNHIISSRYVCKLHVEVTLFICFDSIIRRSIVSDALVALIRQMAIPIHASVIHSAAVKTAVPTRTWLFVAKSNPTPMQSSIPAKNKIKLIKLHT